MSKYIFVCLLLACTGTNVMCQSRLWGFLSNVGKMVMIVPENTSKVTNNVLSVVAKPVLSQCTNLKSLLGLTYDKMDGTKKEPELEELTIEFISEAYNKTYHLGNAASDIVDDRYFNTRQKLYIFVHGWNSNLQSNTFNEIKDALYQSGRHNVLALDSSRYLQWRYLRRSTFVAFIGEKLANVLVGLYKEGLYPEDMHIIGHSLGAHISGFAGKVFQNATGTKIGRITGLDPAGPCFAELDDKYHLNSNDATFVDVIHTNAGLAGITKNVGHVDFYPNGGRNQPGCLIMTCSHGRSAQLFAKSVIYPNSYLAVKCDSWRNFKRGKCAGQQVVPMGLSASPMYQGTYYMQTAGIYGLGINGTQYKRFL